MEEETRSVEALNQLKFIDTLKMRTKELLVLTLGSNYLSSDEKFEFDLELIYKLLLELLIIKISTS